MITIRQPWEITLMRKAGRLLVGLLKEARKGVRPGVIPMDLDRRIEARIKTLGAKPSFLGYTTGPGVPPFPGSICISRNDEVVHGVPGSIPFKEGDLVSVDMGLSLHGYHADAAFTMYLGEPPEEVARAMAVTRDVLTCAIKLVAPGKRVGDIGHLIETQARDAGLNIVRAYTGHGIGRELHEPPLVPNYGKPNTGPILRPGMCICIEPMLTLGSSEVSMLKDGWTVVTEDGSLSLHEEHTILVTEDGAEVLTGSP